MQPLSSSVSHSPMAVADVVVVVVDARTAERPTRRVAINGGDEILRLVPNAIAALRLLKSSVVTIALMAVPAERRTNEARMTQTKAFEVSTTECAFYLW